MNIDIDNRFDYHPPGDNARIFESTRRQFKKLAAYLKETLPDSRESSLTITKLEEALMWANAAIARNGLPPET